MADGGNPRLYDALVAMKPDDMSLNAWAVKAGVNRSIWSDLRKRGNIQHRNLDKLLSAIDVSLAQFEAGEAPVRSEVRGTGIVGSDAVRREIYGDKPSPPLPLYGSAIGGEYDQVEEHIELTELHLNEVIEFIARPAKLQSDPQAYALTIAGDSMAPRFKPGERVAVMPKAAISIGDDVIVQLRGQNEDRVVMVLVKEIVRRGSDYVELLQHNPSVTFRIPWNRVAAMHKVMGHYF